MSIHTITQYLFITIHITCKSYKSLLLYNRQQRKKASLLSDTGLKQILKKTKV